LIAVRIEFLQQGDILCSKWRNLMEINLSELLDPKPVKEAVPERPESKLKEGILAQIRAAGTPVSRSALYRALSGHRNRGAFDRAIQELVNSHEIIQTESRNGKRGRIAAAYGLVPA
jgi:hypothetical protein